ncbi:hypothetical protein EOPP23_02395 [Endozoicomonas sp. OPT23]|uniref:chalcone isomerase family protein n=1 Tax=Endozoicomonas sp. OPT23 TaxID=2072845 RepID=UPI00129C0EDF|nr:chalcone isomerase family protein [Endozoicomonas sp. OPT23]MRI31845.1 hypothetical protein [Endozoicomonas sp. OPT23]
MILRTLIVLSLLFAAPNALASSSFKQVGKARLNVLFWSVYDIELLTPDGLYIPNRIPLKLKITYLRDFSAKGLVNRTREEWAEQGLSHPDSEQWLSQLLKIWPDIKEGDSLELYVDCSNTSQFFFNDQLAGSIKDKDFGSSFLAIWLSEKTSQPNMRSKLLAGKTTSEPENSFCR